MDIILKEINAQPYRDTYIIECSICYNTCSHKKATIEIKPQNFFRIYFEFLAFVEQPSDFYYAFQRAKKESKLSGFNWIEKMPNFSEDEKNYFNSYDAYYYDKEGKKFQANIPKISHYLCELELLIEPLEYVEEVPLFIEKFIEKVLLEHTLSDSQKMKSIKI